MSRDGHHTLFQPYHSPNDAIRVLYSIVYSRVPSSSRGSRYSNQNGDIDR